MCNELTRQLRLEFLPLARNFRPFDRTQMFLLPPSLSDWLPDGDLAYFVPDAVDQMDLTDFLNAYRTDGRGGAGYHPSIMISLLLYAYCRGISSSREIERRCQLDLGFRIVSAQQMPDHTTIARFRRDFITQLGQLFVQILELCAQAGLLKLGRVALDGTKMQANASLEGNLTRKKLRELVEKMLQDAEQIDALEDKLFGEDKRGDELPAHLADPDERRKHLRAAKEKLKRASEAKKRTDEQAKGKLDEYEEKKKAHEQRSAKSKSGKAPGHSPKPPSEEELDKAKANTTDPDSRIHAARQGYCQGYNAQAVVTTDGQIIIAAEVVDAANDMQQLKPMIQKMHKTLQAAGLSEKQVEVVLADSGYWTPQSLTETLSYLREKEQQTELLVAVPKRWAKFKGKTGEASPPEELTQLERIEYRQKSKEGGMIYRERAKSVEPVFGQTKGARGLRRFMLRGKDLVRGEWKLITMTHNLLKLWRHRNSPVTEAKEGLEEGNPGLLSNGVPQFA